MHFKHISCAHSHNISVYTVRVYRVGIFVMPLRVRYFSRIMIITHKLSILQYMLIYNLIHILPSTEWITLIVLSCSRISCHALYLCLLWGYLYLLSKVLRPRVSRVKRYFDHMIRLDRQIQDGCHRHNGTQKARFMRRPWGPHGADRTQVGPMLVPCILLPGKFNFWSTKATLMGKGTFQDNLITGIQIMFFFCRITLLTNKSKMP